MLPLFSLHFSLHFARKNMDNLIRMLVKFILFLQSAKPANHCKHKKKPSNHCDYWAFNFGAGYGSRTQLKNSNNPCKYWIFQQLVCISVCIFFRFGQQLIVYRHFVGRFFFVFFAKVGVDFVHRVYI